MADETSGRRPGESREAGGERAGSSTSGAGGAGSGNGGSGEGARRERSAWSGLWDLQESVSEMVDSALRGLTPAAGRFPRHDLVRIPGQGYRALFDLPGVGKDDLEVTTVGDELTVSGERRRPELPEGAEVLRTERGYGRFRRTVRMPPDVEAGGVRARMEDGVLEITLPRRADSRAHTIEVEG